MEKTFTINQIKQAILHNNLVLLKEFLENIKKYNKNWADYRYGNEDSILHLAAEHDQIDIVKELVINNKSFIDIRNKDYKTSLHVASQMSHYQVVDYLLKEGAFVNSLKIADWTPLMLASTKKGKNAKLTVEKLLENKITLDSKKELILNNGNKTITYLQNKDGWTALMISVRNGDIDIFRLLLEADPNVLKINSKTNRTCLQVACYHGHIDIVKEIIERNVVDVHSIDSSGNTCLYDAILSNHFDLFKLLMDYFNFNINHFNKVGWSYLHIAANVGNKMVIKYLIIEKNLDVNIISLDNLKVTPLHISARNKDLDIYNYLVSFGANEIIIDYCGRMPKNYFDR